MLQMNGFVEMSKNLVNYRSENNVIELSKLFSNLYL